MESADSCHKIMNLEPITSYPVRNWLEKKVLLVMVTHNNTTATGLSFPIKYLVTKFKYGKCKHLVIENCFNSIGLTMNRFCLDSVSSFVCILHCYFCYFWTILFSELINSVNDK